jgi:hypothetical protein
VCGACGLPGGVGAARTRQEDELDAAAGGDLAEFVGEDGVLFSL